MRIIVNCVGGGSHSMMVLDSTTVHSVKMHVEGKEGVPAANQALLFAGRQLAPDSALLLTDLQLDKYSLAHEVVVYMQRQLSAPVKFFLSPPPATPHASAHMCLEVLESSSSLGQVQELLQLHGLTCTAFPVSVSSGSSGTGSKDASLLHAQQHAGQQSGGGVTAPNAAAGASIPSTTTTSSRGSGGCSGSGSNGSSGGGGHRVSAERGSAGGCGGGSCGDVGSNRGVVGVEPGSPNVVVQRQDGSCCSRVRVDEACSIQQLLDAIWQAEGVCPSTLTFFQAQDGCLHAMFGPGSTQAVQ